MSEQIKKMFLEVPNELIDNESLKEPTDLEIFKKNAEYLMQTCERGALPIDEKGEPIDILPYLAKLISGALKIEGDEKNVKAPYSNPLRLLQKHLLTNGVYVKRFMEHLILKKNPEEYLKGHEKEILDDILRTAVTTFKLGMDYGINIKEEDEKK